MEELKKLQNGDEDYFEEDDIFDELEAESRRFDYVKWILMDIIVLGLLLALISVTYLWKNDARRVATEYVKVYAKGDWNTVYNYVHFETKGNPLLSKKMFVTAKGVNYDYTTIAHVKIKKACVLNRDGYHRKLVRVEYVNNENVLKKNVPLVKVRGVWMVDGTKEFILPKVSFEVPQSATVTYDNVKLDKTYLKKTAKGMDHYELQGVFDGYHYLVLEKKGMEKKELLVRLKRKEPVRFTMNYCDETLQAAGKQCQKDIVHAYEKAIAQKKQHGKITFRTNQISVKRLEDAPGILQVTMESAYEYRLQQANGSKRWRTRRGTCVNQCLYTYVHGALKLYDTKIDLSMF